MQKYLFAFPILFLFFVISCKEEYIPKPRGYFRIDFQEKSYHWLDSTGLPYNFEIPDYGKIVPDNDRLAEPYWVNLLVMKHKSELNISYKKVDNNLEKLMQDSFVKQHW